MSIFGRSRNFVQISSGVNRREALRIAGVGAIGAGLLPWAHSATSQGAAPPPQPELAPLNRFPHMVQEYFVRRVRQAQNIGDRLRGGLKTKSDAEAYVANVREKIRACFGPFPAKTPLNPRITGTVDRDVYKIEKVIFESRPGFLVTGNLYIPKGRKFPLPGVIGTCGHSANGKAMEAYQSFTQGLARMGYVVFIFDPIGQGERLQYADEKLKSRIGVGVQEHLYAGNQQFLVGEFLGTWRAWDGIRALDYLLTRPEVDPKHIGVTGNSGGGTMTTWLCGVESRWTMAAPSCFVTTFLRNMENELPADTEQCPPKALALGLDHSDFLAAMAPKPIVILAQEKDFFDCRGSMEAYERLKKLYTLLGAPDNISLFIGPQPHGYSIESRETMYRWFNKQTGISDATKEPELVLEKDPTLWATPRGQVAELKSRTVFSFTSDQAKELSAQRPKLQGDALAAALASALKLPSHRTGYNYRVLRPMPTRKYPRRYYVNYGVETEPGVLALLTILLDQPHTARPPQGIGRAVLYVSHHSADAEMREEPLVAQTIKAEPESAFYACDVRGIGESRPDTCGKDQFLSPYGSDYFYAIHSIMLDQPYVGQKTHDILCVLEWLKLHGHKEVHMVAKGWGAIPATFAAVLSPLVTQVTLKNALTSYQQIAESETYKWPLSTLLPGVLSQFDLPDCYRALEGKKLQQIEPWGPEAT